jgi:hypothetical protein
VAPPKRKTGSGRVTPKGTKPGTLPTAGPPTARVERRHHDDDVAASSRYTPKAAKTWKTESPRWWPAFMLSLFGIGGVVILLKYLGWVPGGQNASQWWIVGGLAFVLGGLFAATRWR